MKICVKEGFPSVKVPVLSVMITFTFSISSKASAFLIKIPFLAPLPIPTITDIGVAKPKAQGQATMRTAKALTKAKIARFSPPKKYQNTKVKTEIAITTGTKILETLSVSFWIGALLLLAEFTISII